MAVLSTRKVAHLLLVCLLYVAVRLVPCGIFVVGMLLLVFNEPNIITIMQLVVVSALFIFVCTSTFQLFLLNKGNIGLVNNQMRMYVHVWWIRYMGAHP